MGRLKLGKGLWFLISDGNEINKCIKCPTLANLTQNILMVIKLVPKLSRFFLNENVISKYPLEDLNEKT